MRLAVTPPSVPVAELLSNHGLCMEELVQLLQRHQKLKNHPVLPDHWKQFVEGGLFGRYEPKLGEVRAMLAFLNIEPL